MFVDSVHFIFVFKDQAGFGSPAIQITEQQCVGLGSGPALCDLQLSSCLGANHKLQLTRGRITGVHQLNHLRAIQVFLPPDPRFRALFFSTKRMNLEEIQ